MSKVHLHEDIKSPWFWGIVGLVGTALLGTIGMGVIAGFSNPGLVAEDYYETGKNYFHQIPDVETHWRLNILPPAKVQLHQPQRYRLYAIDQQGNPMEVGEAKLHAYRPSDASKDFELAMAWEDRGTMAVMAQFDLPGIWDVKAQFTHEGKSQEVIQRVFVEKP
ncbi:MAG: FixH family protein [Zetaproteobacteria bacterium]|nr:FixH family protein [Zetaproteobacteria bacterium]